MAAEEALAAPCSARALAATHVFFEVLLAPLAKLDSAKLRSGRNGPIRVSHPFGVAADNNEFVLLRR
jgi:hypothetical protein